MVVWFLAVAIACSVVLSRDGRDRSAARATVGGEFPTRALAIREVGASCPHGPRFRRPPCAPGRWAFPRPVLPLTSLWSPSHTARSSSADSHPPRLAMVCFPGRSLVLRPDSVRGLLEQPRAQSPLACARCDLAPRGLKGPRQQGVPRRPRAYGLLRQSAPLLGPRSYPQPQGCAGCGPPLRGGGPSRRALCVSCPAGVDLSPGGSWGASTRVFPHDRGLPPVRTGAALHHVRTATSVRHPFRGCRPARLCRPAGVLTTPVAPPATDTSAGQPWL
jgi:hypothetical protein